MGTIKLTDDDHYYAIANAIRNKLGGTQKYTPAEMAPAINAMGGEGFVKPSGTKNITANDTYDVKYYEYVTVAVPSTGITPTGTYTVTANGTYDITNYASVKVQVSDYGIVPSGTRNITANGTYDITSYASVNVNVPMGTAPTATLTITANDTYDVTEYGTVIVQVSGLNPTGTKTITENGTYDISTYASVYVNVSDVTPSGTYNITANGTYDISSYATVKVQVPSVSSGIFDIDDDYMVVIVNDPKIYATNSNYTTLSALQTYLETTYVFTNGTPNDDNQIIPTEHKPAYTFLMMNPTNTNVLARFKLLKDLGYGYCFGEVLTDDQKSTLASNGFTDSIAICTQAGSTSYYAPTSGNHENYINNGFSFICGGDDGNGYGSYYGAYNTKYTSPLELRATAVYSDENVFSVLNGNNIYGVVRKANINNLYDDTFTIYYVCVIGDNPTTNRVYDFYRIMYTLYYSDGTYVATEYDKQDLDNHIKTLNYICSTYTNNPVHIEGGSTTTVTVNRSKITEYTGIDNKINGYGAFLYYALELHPAAAAGALPNNATGSELEILQYVASTYYGIDTDGKELATLKSELQALPPITFLFDPTTVSSYNTIIAERIKILVNNGFGYAIRLLKYSDIDTSINTLNALKSEGLVDTIAVIYNPAMQGSITNEMFKYDFVTQLGQVVDLGTASSGSASGTYGDNSNILPIPLLYSSSITNQIWDIFSYCLHLDNVSSNYPGKGDYDLCYKTVGAGSDGYSNHKYDIRYTEWCFDNGGIINPYGFNVLFFGNPDTVALNALITDVANSAINDKFNIYSLNYILNNSPTK